MSKLKEIFHQLKGEGYHGTFEGFMKRVDKPNSNLVYRQ